MIAGMLLVVVCIYLCLFGGCTHEWPKKRLMLSLILSDIRVHPLHFAMAGLGECLARCLADVGQCLCIAVTNVGDVPNNDKLAQG